MYAITGRHKTSKDRLIEQLWNGGVFYNLQVVAPSAHQLPKHQRDLYEYISLMAKGRCVAISNGQQTDDVFASAYGQFPSLFDGLRRWSYEGDEHCTPRIAAMTSPQNGDLEFGIIRRHGSGVIRMICIMRPIAGEGNMLKTYAGSYRDPLPSFTDDPIKIEMPWNSAKEAATALRAAIVTDFFVAAFAAIFHDDEVDAFIINTQN